MDDVKEDDHAPHLRRAKVNFPNLMGYRRQKWVQTTWEVVHWSHFFLQLMRVRSRVAGRWRGHVDALQEDTTGLISQNILIQ